MVKFTRFSSGKSARRTTCTTGASTGCGRTSPKGKGPLRDIARRGDDDDDGAEAAVESHLLQVQCVKKCVATATVFHTQRLSGNGRVRLLPSQAARTDSPSGFVPAALRLGRSLALPNWNIGSPLSATERARATATNGAGPEAMSYMGRGGTFDVSYARQSCGLLT
jgi:hypothetical protein